MRAAGSPRPPTDDRTIDSSVTDAIHEHTLPSRKCGCGIRAPSVMLAIRSVHSRRRWRIRPRPAHMTLRRLCLAWRARSGFSLVGVSLQATRAWSVRSQGGSLTARGAGRPPDTRRCCVRCTCREPAGFGRLATPCYPKISNSAWRGSAAFRTCRPSSPPHSRPTPWCRGMHPSRACSPRARWCGRYRLAPLRPRGSPPFVKRTPGRKSLRYRLR